MRILLTIPTLDISSGGPPQAVAMLTEELRNRGNEVSVVYCSTPGISQVPLPVGVAGFALSQPTGAVARFSKFSALLESTIKKTKVQIIHDRGMWLPENAAAMRAARVNNLPLILQPCGMLQNWSLRQSRLKKKLAWRLYQRGLATGAAAVITTSEDEHSETAQHFPSTVEQACIPHGIELPDIAASTTRQRQAVFLGRLHPKKQVDVLLRAWARLRPQGWRLLIAGGGEREYERQLRQIAEQSGLEDSVHFLGIVEGEAKSALLAGSQLFLQPSLQENFGIAVAEALAHGLPVLTTRSTPWSAIEASGCGWWVTSDVTSVEATLSRALALTPQQLATMGEQARKLATRYSWSEAVRQTLALYERVIAQRGLEN